MLRLTKTKLAIPALIVLIVAGAAGYQIYSQYQARAALGAALANLPVGSLSHYDGMSFNAFTQTLRISGLAITRDGHPSLRIQSVTLHHLAGSGTLADPFRASSVRLVGSEVWRGSRSLTAALVDGQTIDVLAPGVPVPAGTPSWLAAPRSGTLVSATSITATTVADSEGATLAAVSVSGYAAGQLQQATASGFADAHGNRIATVAAHALDLDGLDAVFDTGRYGAGEPPWPAPRPLIGHAEVVGLQSQTKGVSIAVDRMTLDGFAARPFATAPNSAYVKTQAFLRDAASAMSVSAASVTGLHYSDDQAKLSGMFTALSVSGYADGALAQASLDGLAISGSGASRVAVGHFEITGLDATKLVQDRARYSTVSLLTAARNGGVHLAALALATVSVTPPSGQTITLDAAEQSTTGGAPAHFTAQMRGLTIPGQSNPELAQGLGALGVDRLVLDLDEAGTYDIVGGTAALAPLVLTARGLGSLSLSAEFSNVPQDLPPGTPALDALGAVSIGRFTLRFTNRSLVERVIAMQARQSHKTAQEVTDEAKLAGSFAAAAMVPDQADAGQQAASFVTAPRSLTITATPAAPIPLSAFLGAGRDAAKTALNLRLSAD